jgi:hypothetical protein
MPKDDPRHDQAAFFGTTGRAGAGRMTLIAETQHAIDRSGCWSGDRLICMAVSDLPVAHVPSYLDQCGVCGTAVWRSDRSGWFRALPICTRCASEAIRACQARGEGSVVRAAPYVGEDLPKGKRCRNRVKSWRSS